MPTTSVITLLKFLDSALLQHRSTLLMAYPSVVTLSPGIWRIRNINAGQATSSPVSFGAMRNTQLLTKESCVLIQFCSLKTEQHITSTHTSNPPFSTQTIFKTK